MIEILGYIAGFMFAICGAPQAYQSFKQGHSKGISSAFISLWLGGEVLTLAYVLLKHGFDGPLVLNYSMNLVFLSIIIYYKIKPRA